MACHHSCLHKSVRFAACETKQLMQREPTMAVSFLQRAHAVDAFCRATKVVLRTDELAPREPSCRRKLKVVLRLCLQLVKHVLESVDVEEHRSRVVFVPFTIHPLDEMPDGRLLEPLQFGVTIRLHPV